MIDLNELAKKTLENATKRMNNGANISIETRGMLKHCATEVVEATEAFCFYESIKNFTSEGTNFEGFEEPDSAEQTYIEDKEHFSNELADIICCVLIMASKENIDIEKAVLDCIEKNRKRADGMGDKL